MNRLGLYIAEQRRLQGISQEKLALLMEYDRSNLSNMENGRLSPSNEVLEMIAGKLNLSYEKLYILRLIDKLPDGYARTLLVELKTMEQDGLI